MNLSDNQNLFNAGDNLNLFGTPTSKESFLTEESSFYYTPDDKKVLIGINSQVFIISIIYT